MKNKLITASFLGLMICFSCKKQINDPIVVEQKAFENLPSCCKNDPCNTPVELKNITGKLKSFATDTKDNSVFYNIIPDSTFNISDKQLPLFKYYGSVFSICNMPDKIINSNSPRKVKFDCKLIYLDIPTNTGGQIPQTDGYPAQLSRIELLD